MTRRLAPTTSHLDARESAAVHAKRMANLERANRVRMRKARVKEKLRSGELSLAAFVKKVPPEVRTAGVFEILCEARGIGPHRAGKIMRAARFSPHASFSWVKGPAKKRLLAAIAEVKPLDTHPPKLNGARPANHASRKASKSKAGAVS